MLIRGENKMSNATRKEWKNLWTWFLNMMDPFSPGSGEFRG